MTQAIDFMEYAQEVSIETSCYYPNKMRRIVLTALEQIAGRHGVNAILNLANLPHLVDNYPVNNLKRNFSTDLTVRMLPLGIKLKIGLDVFAETVNKFSDQKVRLSEDERGFLWIIERCPICWERTSESPCCHSVVGLLEESLAWVSRERQVKVEEVFCIAMGDENCTITIPKKPIS